MNRYAYLAALAAGLLLAGVTGPLPAQSPADPAPLASIVVQRPTVYPDTRESRSLLERALVQGAAHAGRTHRELVVSTPWAPSERTVPDPTPARSSDEGGGGTGRGIPEYRVTVNAVNDANTPTISLTLAGTGSVAGQSAAGIPITRRWDGDVYREVAQQIFYLWAQARGFRTLEHRDPPVFVDELNLAELVGSTLSATGANLYPYSAARMPDGGVVVGAISLAVHLGPDFRVVDLPGRSLLEGGNYASAMTVAATPAGTVVTRPSMGRDLYVYRRGVAEPERIRSPLTGQGAMAALPDGSIVVTDVANRQAIRLEGRSRTPLPLYQEDYSYIPAVAAGPEGNIWTFDTSQRVVQIFAPDGTFLESILPAIPLEHAAGVRAMTVGPGGDMLLLTTGGLWRLDRSGAPVWSTTTLGDGSQSGLGQMMGLSWDPEIGAIWLVDYMGQRVIRLQEPADIPAGGDATSAGAVTDGERRALRTFTDRILTLNRRLEAATGPEARGEIIAEKARLYEDRGALEMAQAQWQLVLDQDPFHPDALDRIDGIEVALLRREAGRLDTAVRRLLDEYGRETARDDYERTIRVYERILNLAPDADDVRRAEASLEARFEERARPAAEYDLRVAVEVDQLFPVLLERYRREGAGTIRVTNAGAAGVSDLAVTVEIPGFTDGAGDVPLPTDLAAGTTVGGALPVLLNRSVLELQEDLSVPVIVTATYTVDGAAASTTSRAETTLHRRTALVWDDSAKLASFVTPNEEVIAGFALRSLSSMNAAAADGDAEHLAALSHRVYRAMQLADALGSYGITYVEDPRSPFSEVQGRSTAVDTIRFPRTTLYYRSGDCDDTSALLASLYEAAGLDTAIVTTPGHVMIAVDTREPVGNRWIYETGTTTMIEHAGTLWLPVETTILDRGFPKAWESASNLVSRHRDAGEVELLPIRDVRDRYPSLPLPSSSFAVTEPPESTLTERVDESATYTAALLYENSRAQLENQLASRAGSRRIPVLNRLGVLHARFGRSDRARAAFEEVISLRNDYLPAFVNLANLELLDGDPAAALDWLDEAELLRPDSPAVMELMARALAAAGSGRQAREYVARLRDRDPDRALALAALLPPSGRAALDSEGTGRASAGGDPTSLLPPAEWPVEEP